MQAALTVYGNATYITTLLWYFSFIVYVMIISMMICYNLPPKYITFNLWGMCMILSVETYGKSCVRIKFTSIIPRAQPRSQITYRN